MWAPIYLDEMQLTANTYLRIDGKDMYYFALPVKKNDEVQGQDSEGLGQAANSNLADYTHVPVKVQGGSTCGDKPPLDGKVKDPAGNSTKAAADQHSVDAGAAASNDKWQVGCPLAN